MLFVKSTFVAAWDKGLARTSYAQEEAEEVNEREMMQFRVFWDAALILEV
jgi:hypothetical protein